MKWILWKENPKIKPQSDSVMSALTIIQDVRHGALVHIYSLLLPGKYKMRINIALNINILIVTARQFEYNRKGANELKFMSKQAWMRK